MNMNRLFLAVERFLLAACLGLLAFFYIYVYAMGRVRGPLAKYEFYRRGEVDDEKRAIEEAMLGGEESLKSAPDEADTAP